MTCWSAIESASAIAASINNCWSIFCSSELILRFSSSSSSCEVSLLSVDDSVSFKIFVTFSVWKWHKVWPRRIGSPDLKSKTRLSGASKTRTIVEPKLKSPKLSPRLSKIPFEFLIVWNVFSNLGRRRLFVFNSLKLSE